MDSCEAFALSLVAVPDSLSVDRTVGAGHRSVIAVGGHIWHRQQVVQKALAIVQGLVLAIVQGQ